MLGCSVFLFESTTLTFQAKLQATCIINPQRACAARVGPPSVCVPVSQQLTFGASVRPENDTTYSTGNEGQNIYLWGVL